MGKSSNLAVFEPVAAPSTYQETVARLGIAIRIGLLTPGSRLPPERDLAEQLGISRSTLRQALAHLTQTGHLMALRGRSGGTFVAAAPPLASAVPYPLERTRALLDWRMPLELGTVQLAAERATDRQLEQVREAAEAFEDETVISDWAAFRRADAALHLKLAEAAHSGRIVDAMTRVQGELSDLFFRLEPPLSARVAASDEHLDVGAAVVRGDAAGAREAMRVHLESTERLIEALMSEQLLTPAA